MRSISREASPLAPTALSFMGICSIVMRLERRNAYRRRGVFDRHRKSDADEDALVARVQYRGDDPDHLAIHGGERPAGVSGVGRGVELDQVGQQTLAFRRAVFAFQAGKHASRYRRADAERKTDGDELVAQGPDTRR